LSSFEEGLV